jgi:hypothetical protein
MLYYDFLRSGFAGYFCSFWKKKNRFSWGSFFREGRANGDSLIIGGNIHFHGRLAGGGAV